jgi:hypothetical protein
MQKINLIWVLGLSLFFWSSCSNGGHSSGDIILAKVGDKYLYISEFSGNILPNIGKTDSIQLINSFVDNWVRQEILLQHAIKNLPDSLKDFRKQLKTYENNLIIYEFKKRLVDIRLNVEVTDKEIMDYYKTHTADFELKENIVRFAFIKIPVQSNRVALARKHMKDYSDFDSHKAAVDEFCKKNATDFFLNSDAWTSFNEMAKRVPIVTFNQELYLHNNNFIEIKDFNHWYFINIIDFKIKEQISPIDFEREKIKNIILNKRKIELFKKLEEDIYNAALENDKIEIY